MSKRRMVHDSFFQSEGVAIWTMRQRLLVLGMISAADDQGRLKGNPLWLRSKIFPYDMVSADDIASDLAAIASTNDTILLYQVDGRSYIQLVHWWDYQNLQWAGPSDSPPPDGWQDRIRQMIYKPKRWVMTVNWPETEDRTDFEIVPPEVKSGNGLGNGLGNALPISNTNTNTNTNVHSLKGGMGGNQDIFVRAARKSLVNWWLKLVGGSLPSDSDLARSKLYDPADVLLERLNSDVAEAKELLEKKRDQMLADGKTPKWLEAMVPYLIADMDKPTHSGHQAVGAMTPIETFEGGGGIY